MTGAADTTRCLQRSFRFEEALFFTPEAVVATNAVFRDHSMARYVFVGVGTHNGANGTGSFRVPCKRRYFAVGARTSLSNFFHHADNPRAKTAVS